MCTFFVRLWTTYGGRREPSVVHELTKKCTHFDSDSTTDRQIVLYQSHSKQLKHFQICFGMTSSWSPVNTLLY